MNSSSPELKRNLSLSLLALYGLGNILGAGIYVLIGKVVATAGIFTPWSFLIALVVSTLLYMVLAGFSGPRWIPVAGFSAAVGCRVGQSGRC